MTVTDPDSRTARHASSEIELQIPSQARPGPPSDEPPAGLGPWVPPLPEPPPGPSARTLTWIGIVAVLVVIAMAAAVAVMVSSAAAPVRTRADGLYLGSVRTNSSLSGADVDDEVLVRTGHAVCDTIDRRPATTTVLVTMRELGGSFGWGDDDVAAVVGSAIGAYCPRHITLIEA